MRSDDVLVQWHQGYSVLHIHYGLECPSLLQSKMIIPIETKQVNSNFVSISHYCERSIAETNARGFVNDLSPWAIRAVNP